MVFPVDLDIPTFKVIVSLLGDEDKMVRVWKVGGPGECHVRIHTQSKKGSLLSRSEV